LKNDLVHGDLQNVLCFWKAFQSFFHRQDAKTPLSERQAQLKLNVTRRVDRSPGNASEARAGRIGTGPDQHRVVRRIQQIDPEQRLEAFGYVKRLLDVQVELLEVVLSQPVHALWKTPAVVA